MEFLRLELDETAAKPCGRCARCIGSSPRPDRGRPGDRRSSHRVPPQPELHDRSRAERPGGGLPKAERNESGLVLSVYDDGGWGALVKTDKEAGSYSDTLADALVELQVGPRSKPDPNG